MLSEAYYKVNTISLLETKSASKMEGVGSKRGSMPTYAGEDGPCHSYGPGKKRNTWRRRHELISPREGVFVIKASSSKNVDKKKNKIK